MSMYNEHTCAYKILQRVKLVKTRWHKNSNLTNAKPAVSFNEVNKQFHLESEMYAADNVT